MKVLLIYPPMFNLVFPSLPETVEKDVGRRPPLGILYIASFLKNKTSHEVKILDTQVEKMSYFDIEKKVKDFGPDIVGISTMTYMLYDVILTAKIVKGINKNIHVCLGGPHTSIYPNETLRIPEVDSIVVGDGEIAFAELVESLSEGREIKTPGVFESGRDDNLRINSLDPAYYIKDLDQLPFPARSLTPYKKYFSAVSRRSIVTSIVTSRGCPYKCIFCQLPFNKLRMRSAKNVVDEMEKCCLMGINEIDIYDDTFNFSEQRVIAICDEIIKRKLKIGWSFRGRVDKVSKRMLERAKLAGCERIHYGVEAGSQKTLDILKKVITLEQIKTAFRLTKDVGISTLAYFMVGSPGEAREDIMNTIRFAEQLEPDLVTFSITTPWPGTEMYRMGLEQGVIKRDYWKEFVLNPKEIFIPPFWEENLKFKELVKIRNFALKKFYLRPKFIIKSLSRLTSFGELKRKCTAGFGLIRELIFS